MARATASQLTAAAHLRADLKRINTQPGLTLLLERIEAAQTHERITKPAAAAISKGAREKLNKVRYQDELDAARKRMKALIERVRAGEETEESVQIRATLARNNVPAPPGTPIDIVHKMADQSWWVRTADGWFYCNTYHETSPTWKPTATPPDGKELV